MIASLRRIEARDFWPAATLASYALLVAVMLVMALILTGVIETPAIMTKQPAYLAATICMFVTSLTMYIQMRTIYASYPSAKTAPRWFYWSVIASEPIFVILCVVFVYGAFRHV